METRLARTVGWTSLLLVLCHYLKPSLMNMLPFDTPHLVVNLVLGLLGIQFAQENVSPRYRRMFIALIGGCFLLSGVIGFFIPQWIGYGFSFIQNLLHLIFGTWAIWCLIPERAKKKADVEDA